MQLRLAIDEPTDDKTFALQIDEGFGWRNAGPTADHPRDLIHAAYAHRRRYPSVLLKVTSRDPRHDHFIAGWGPGEIPDKTDLTRR